MTRPPPQPLDRYLAHPADDVGASDPLMWLLCAHRLLFGGQQLWDLAARFWASPSPETHPGAGQHATAFLLFGYALENAIKGVLVQHLRAEGKIVVTPDGKLQHIPTTGHALLRLAWQAGIDLDPDEENVLRRLETYVQSFGRYPVMKAIGPFRPGQIIPDSALHPDADRPLVEKLFDKVVSHYDERFIRLAAQLGERVRS